MDGIMHRKTEITGLAREMDSPAAVIFTSIYVMKQCLQRIADDAGNEDSVVNRLRQSLDLAAVASERLVKSSPMDSGRSVRAAVETF